MEPARFTLKPASFALALAAIAAVLVVASVAGQLMKFVAGHDYVFGLVPLFNLNEETNLPTLYAVLLLLLAAALLVLITLLEKRNRGPDVMRWAVLAGGFLAMAIDEFSSLHELLIEPMRRLLGGGRLGLLYFAWVVPALLLLPLLALYFLGFLRRVRSRTRTLFLLAAALYLGGAVGVELFEGRHRELHGTGPVFQAYVTVEESLELAGLVLFVYALLDLLARRHGEVSFGFASTARVTAPMRGATAHTPAAVHARPGPAAGPAAASAASPRLRTSD